MATRKRASREKSPAVMVKLDFEQVKFLASLGTSMKKIAEAFNISPDYVRTNFNEAFQAGRTELTVKLRQAQLWKALVKKDTTMLIWLGKQYLGQRDAEETINHSITASMIRQDNSLEEAEAYEQDKSLIVDKDKSLDYNKDKNLSNKSYFSETTPPMMLGENEGVSYTNIQDAAMQVNIPPPDLDKRGRPPIYHAPVLDAEGSKKGAKRRIMPQKMHKNVIRKQELEDSGPLES